MARHGMEFVIPKCSLTAQTGIGIGFLARKQNTQPMFRATWHGMEWNSKFQNCNCTDRHWHCIGFLARKHTVELSENAWVDVDLAFPDADFSSCHTTAILFMGRSIHREKSKRVQEVRESPTKCTCQFQLQLQLLLLLTTSDSSDMTRHGMEWNAILRTYLRLCQSGAWAQRLLVSQRQRFCEVSWCCPSTDTATFAEACQLWWPTWIGEREKVGKYNQLFNSV